MLSAFKVNCVSSGQEFSYNAHIDGASYTRDLPEYKDAINMQADSEVYNGTDKHRCTISFIFQSCFMEATTTANGVLYRMGCQPSAVCSAQGHSPGIVGRFIEQPEQTTCHECCPGNLCNDHPCTRSIIGDCSDLLKTGRSWPSGVYTMDTWQTQAQVDVFCDMDTDGGGWTVRIINLYTNSFTKVDGSVDFFKNFSSYENGFGSLHGDFWLGLRYLNEITSRRKNTLRIELQTPNATRLYDVYEEFSVGPVGSTYLFSPYHDGMAFTTYDHDMDQLSVSNCANEYHGAWWYNSCYYANLNGQYFVPGTHNGTGITYNSFKFLISLKESKMMFK
ncbi:FCN2-like protein [Mya arenaria]|uniref:FCN2-like protein n=1 Tax=Mya arenaria TaxID=6604 RepID=A0ABY7G7P2_MYAAR|nr:FCN2-like protein [Mya arenaria]